jgi:predicted dehydrogenase
MAIALRAAQAGCHLFIEKPLSHNWEQVEELMGLAEARHIHAAVGYHMRFHPCLQRLSSLLQGRRVGRILAVRSEVGSTCPGGILEDYRQMYAWKNWSDGLSQSRARLHLLALGTAKQLTLGDLSLEIDVEDR